VLVLLLRQQRRVQTERRQQSEQREERQNEHDDDDDGLDRPIFERELLGLCCAVAAHGTARQKKRLDEETAPWNLLG